MIPEIRATFKDVVLAAASLKKELKQVLAHTKYMHFSQVNVVTKSIESLMLDRYPDLDKAEVRRFSELITGTNARINHEAQKMAEEFIEHEIKLFKNYKRQLMLDQRYDIQNDLTNTYNTLLKEWLNNECPDSKEIERKIGFFHAFAHGAKHCDPLVQKDIESYITSRAVIIEKEEMNERQEQELERFVRSNMEKKDE